MSEGSMWLERLLTLDEATKAQTVPPPCAVEHTIMPRAWACIWAGMSAQKLSPERHWHWQGGRETNSKSPTCLPRSVP
ncbi:hypothetical protein [Dictyobacter formicarum]|uniref:hypothetical protein n=1 Tax=Dictyobacter formicarum TaxID=2778368 RepID=UPI001F3A97EB|nr:hypothetical protein [Dictyobacter formicarum]